MSFTMTSLKLLFCYWRHAQPSKTLVHQQCWFSSPRTYFLQIH